MFEIEFPHYASSRRILRRDFRNCTAPPSRRLCRAALLLIVDLLEIGVDNLVIAAASPSPVGRPALWRATVTGAGLFSLLGPVKRLPELHRDLGQRLCLGLDLPRIFAAEGILQGLHRLLHRVAVGLRNLVATLVQCPLGRMNERVGVILCLDQLAT